MSVLEREGECSRKGKRQCAWHMNEWLNEKPATLALGLAALATLGGKESYRSLEASKEPTND